MVAGATDKRSNFFSFHEAVRNYISFLILIKKLSQTNQLDVDSTKQKNARYIAAGSEKEQVEACEPLLLSL